MTQSGNCSLIWNNYLKARVEDWFVDLLTYSEITTAAIKIKAETINQMFLIGFKTLISFLINWIKCQLNFAEEEKNSSTVIMLDYFCFNSCTEHASNSKCFTFNILIFVFKWEKKNPFLCTVLKNLSKPFPFSLCPRETSEQ